ncbi:MAG: dockerin type I repeat-containing protein [Prevotella sp.]|nr:dockerin type I repeat-containing protein [Prevotella sp.]
MKKIYLSLVALLSFSVADAQTILFEDFETGNTGSQLTPVAAGEGWTTVNSYSGTNVNFTWHNYYSDPEAAGGPTIGGACCAACDGPISVNPTDGSGPREEILLSPELDLNDTYQLQFSWKVSPMNANANSKYDLQVRIVTDGNLQGAETVFSIQNEDMLRESGVTVFPIDTWDLHISKVDLSDWKGEKVKIAFVYKMLTTSANVVWLDDISVKQFTPAAGPVATVSLDRYDFGDIFIGEKKYSDVITLTNTGKNGLKITGVDFPEGIGVSPEFDADLNLRAYDYVTFQLTYTASMTSKASGNAVIHTTGGDVTIAYTATKQLLPEDANLETFEAYFPPAGWKNNGWSWTTSAIEGDHSVYCSGDFTATYLRSPQLDLSEGGEVTFTYYNMYNGDTAPEYDIELQVSYDGGDTWETRWVSDWQDGLNKLLTATVDLGEGTEESFIRWYYPAIEYDDEGAFDHSSFTLDRVMLPRLYGADGVPGKVTMLSPANNATEIYPKDVVLQWGPAQFAEGYKLYVGANSAANDLIDGLDLGDALTYTIPVCAYETLYRWKVVAYNSEGNGASTTWRFTTQADASVMEFPWEENFDACTNSLPVPSGWLSTGSEGAMNFAKWSPNSIYPYGGKGASLSAGWLNAGESVTLTSPEFTLPADGKSMSISFVWGNEHPSDLIIDETGLLQKQNVPGGNGKDEVVFEIYSDGQWKQASYLSENANDNGKKYWRNETIDLDQYAGKTIQFRWTAHCISGQNGYGTLDNVVIDGTIVDGVAFNKESWDAGLVNYGMGASSGNLLTIRNSGKNALKVKAVTFGTDHFESSIAVGQELAVGEGMPFDITFWAKSDAKTVEDVMSIEFENGYIATFPVKGTGLAKDVLYYGFEPNTLDYEWKEDFTQIDVDKKTNYDLSYYETEVENDGGRYAFTGVTHYNDNLTARSGNHTIAAAAPADNSAANDWLISKKLKMGKQTVFDFYAHNLGTASSVFVGDNDYHSVTVLVSEAGNTNTADFTVVMRETQMPYLGNNEWNHYVVDLSEYAGKEVYVALRHTTVSANWLAFFDDFTFSGLDAGKKGDVNGDGSVDVADIACIIDVMAGTAVYETADVNDDKTVDVADIASVITIMAEGE